MYSFTVPARHRTIEADKPIGNPTGLTIEWAHRPNISMAFEEWLDEQGVEHPFNEGWDYHPGTPSKEVHFTVTWFFEDPKDAMMAKLRWL